MTAYWDVERSDGALYRIDRDRRTEVWFADGLYDQIKGKRKLPYLTSGRLGTRGKTRSGSPLNSISSGAVARGTFAAFAAIPLFVVGFTVVSVIGRPLLPPAGGDKPRPYGTPAE